MTTRFRFGVQTTQPLPGMTWMETARAVERMGYSTLQVPDHLGDQYAPMPAIAAALTATEHLRAGALVFANDYRHPVVLAKELATLDAMFPGRVEFGLGAGWMREDYDISGIGYDEPKVRVDRFVEALDVIAGHFTGEPFTFHGDHYDIDGLVGRPRTVTPGGPSLLIGGGGKRVLTIAARRASIVGINPNLKAGAIGMDALTDSLPDRFTEKVSWVRDGAGSRIDDIELNIRCFVVNVTESPAASEEAVGGVAAMFGIDRDIVLDIPLALIGTVDELCDRIERRRERWGLSYYTVGADEAEMFAPVVSRLAGR